MYTSVPSGPVYLPNLTLQLNININGEFISQSNRHYGVDVVDVIVGACFGP